MACFSFLLFYASHGTTEPVKNHCHLRLTALLFTSAWGLPGSNAGEFVLQGTGLLYNQHKLHTFLSSHT
jgi:hypothetical protein